MMFPKEFSAPAVFAHDGLDQVEGTHGRLTVAFDPVAEVFPELRLEDSFSTFTFQGQVRYGLIHGDGWQRGKGEGAPFWSVTIFLDFIVCLH